MLMRVVTDFNVFDVGILDLFVNSYSLPSWEWSQRVDLIDITGTTSISNYGRMISACWLHWCLILHMTTGYCTAQGHNKALKGPHAPLLLSVMITALYRSVWGCWHAVTSVQLFFLIPPHWPLWFSVCFVSVFHIVQNVKTNKNNIN